MNQFTKRRSLLLQQKRSRVSPPPRFSPSPHRSEACSFKPIGKNFRRASSRKRHRHCTLPPSPLPPPGLNPPVVGHAASCPAQNARGDSRFARLDEPPHLSIVIDEIIKYYSADGFFWSNAKPSEVARNYQTSVAKVEGYAEKGRATRGKIEDNFQARNLYCGNFKLTTACNRGTITTMQSHLGELHCALASWVDYFREHLLRAHVHAFSPTCDARYSVCIKEGQWPLQSLRALPMVRNQLQRHIQSLRRNNKHGRLEHDDVLAYLCEWPGSTILQVGGCCLIAGSSAAANSQLFQSVEHINWIYSLCPAHDFFGSCLIMHPNTEAVIEARFDVNLLFTHRIELQKFMENVLAPIWHKLFTALYRSAHGAGGDEDLISSLEELEQILVHCMWGKSRTLIILIAILCGFFWRYTYELEDFFTYIEKLRPIVELKEHDFTDGQGDGLVRRALGVQG